MAITREFQNPRKSYLLELCRQAQKTFDRLDYFNASVDALKSISFGPSPLSEADKEKCALITRNIFIELIEIGYSKEYVERVPERLFGGYYNKNSQIITDFPHDVPFPAGDNPDIETYFKRLKDKLDSLTDVDRVEALKSIANAEATERTYIFQVRGLRGTAELKVGPVLFYAPQVRNLVTDFSVENSDIELFGAKKGANFLNAAVAVLTKDDLSGSTAARSLVISALKVLRFFYNPRTKYELGPSYIVIRDGGKWAGGAHVANKSEQFWILQDSLELSSDLVTKRPPEFDKIGTLFVQEKRPIHDIDRRIMASMHWYRRAREAESDTDRLLWYWITMESLLRKDKDTPNMIMTSDTRETSISIALELLPFIRSKNIAYQKGWVLRRRIYYSLKARSITITPALLIKADLQDGPRTIHLEPFVDSIPEIVKGLSNVLLIDQLNEVYRFYTDSNYALESLEKERKMAREEVLLIYRMRNKIVHNAEYETSMLPYTISSALLFSHNLLS